MKDRLDFMACPFCSGHEKIGAETIEFIEPLLRDNVRDAQEHVYAEMKNILNQIENSREPGRPEPARPEESWLDA